MPVTSPTRAILVVDDDEMMRELLSAIFTMEGYAVTTACSGEEAVAAMQQASAFDVVLADLHMPGLAGRELAFKLDSLRVAPTALIGMSGREPSDAERKSFDAFLVKPFDMPVFLQAVSDVQAARKGMHHAKPPHLDDKPRVAAVLDETVYGKLAATLPHAQLQALYDLALHDVERRTLAIREAFARGDINECRREAHAIKGSCAMVGAAELSSLASAIEAGAFADTPPLDELTSACARLRGMLEARSTTAKP